MTELIEVLSEWQNNLSFRERFKANPELALREAGLTLNPEDLEKVRAILNFDGSKNDKLDDRISK